MSDAVESTPHDDKVKDPKHVPIIVNTRKHNLPKKSARLAAYLDDTIPEPPPFYWRGLPENAEWQV